MSFPVPKGLEQSCRSSLERTEWLRKLPETIRRCEARWRMHAGEPFRDASCAWVAPVHLEDGASAVLKIGMPHMEAEQEIAGLRFWDGDGMVRLLNADEDVSAMLLERCDPGTPLRALVPTEQDVVIASLLRRLWRVPPRNFRFRPLAEMTAFWSERTLAQEAQWADAGLVREGLRLFAELPRTASEEALLATDLHAGNVLKARREPWLAIDPKPFFGDTAYDATQHFFNCLERLSEDPVGWTQRMAELLAVDWERVRLWMFARLAAEPRENWREDWILDLTRAIAPRL